MPLQAATQLTTDVVTGQESSVEKTAKATGKGVVIGIATTLTAVAVVGGINFRSYCSRR